MIYLGLVTNISTPKKLYNKIIKNDIDISYYANPAFDSKQMEQILLGLAEGIDVSIYNNPSYNWKTMCRIRKKLIKLKHKNEKNKIKYSNCLYCRYAGSISEVFNDDYDIDICINCIYQLSSELKLP